MRNPTYRGKHRASGIPDDREGSDYIGKHRKN
jgi:hypothetical protein